MAKVTYVYWRGSRLNKTSIASLVEVEKRSKLPLRVTQGGANAGLVAASAGTHDGLGVVDLSVHGWSAAERNRCCKWLRMCGWAAWVRTPAQGFVWHIHAVRIGDTSASRGARAQVIAYKNGRNGLAGNGRDTQARPGVVTWGKSKYNPANRPKPKPTLVIGDKTYPDVPYVSAWYVNESRRTTGFSRHTYIVSCWLTRAGYATDGRRNTAVWSPVLQADYDAFRWANHEALKIATEAEAGGPVDFASLKLLRSKVGSTRQVREGKK